MFEQFKAFVDYVWYGDFAAAAWIITVLPIVISVVVQIPGVVKALKENKDSEQK